MSKQVAVKAQKTIVRKAALFAREGVVRTIRFVAGPNAVIVTCRGLPRIVVKKDMNGSGFWASVRDAHRGMVFVPGNTPGSAYRSAVEQFWL